jgi:hypothetical protein
MRSKFCPELRISDTAAGAEACNAEERKKKKDTPDACLMHTDWALCFFRAHSGICSIRFARAHNSRCIGLQELQDETVPELQRTHLAQSVLLLKAAGIDSIMTYPWLDAPPAEVAVRAMEQLFALGALNEDAKCEPPCVLVL